MFIECKFQEMFSGFSNMMQNNRVVPIDIPNTGYVLPKNHPMTPIGIHPVFTGNETLSNKIVFPQKIRTIPNGSFPIDVNMPMTPMTENPPPIDDEMFSNMLVFPQKASPMSYQQK